MPDAIREPARQTGGAMIDHEARELDRILGEGRITPLFQPIVDAGCQGIFGYEALARGPSDSPLHSPLTLFDTAKHTGRLVELDLLCRRLAIEAFARLDLPGRLFLNVMPTSLLEHDFQEGLTRAFLDGVGLSPERVVIELTEHLPIHDYALMRQAVDHYRRMGFQVALDDLGAGYSSLRHWAELRPDFVKVDRHFVQDIDRDPGKCQFLNSLLEVSRSLGCRVIAEGIETDGEQRCLWGMNCTLMQGYHFARPALDPPRRLEPSGSALPSISGTFGTSAAMLCRHLGPVAQGTPVPEVVERFRRDPELRCLAVLDDDRRPVGLVRQHEFLGLFTNPFSHALHARRDIDTLMDRRMLVVEESMPLEALSRRVTGSPKGRRDDFVIVDGAGRYRGLGQVIDLLREITALQVRSARQANPLTGLPGNEVINDTLAARLAEGAPFAAVYADLDHFKAYNDAYGYAQGDQVILALARSFQQEAGDDGFVGHVGGDDFMLVLPDEAGRARCEAILSRFERFIPSFYSREHRRAGGFPARNRQGEAVFVPPMTLSLAYHAVSPGTGRTAMDIANVLAELKGQAKRRPGNSLFIDRRQ
ncbi:bifunctional diguanylate cyclase/phosphodiesterase [Halomonas beimenensis]|uniref:Diguanylate cyclase/phosphodiesterase (GGDEF & EAL domains) with PAS/PAC sensor(S) n=1 Tax=Halomonas beimenensis TaxID=475662 RepID=A0A291PCM2_9GAMM|nr:bifunctional diguanylate cyclase/phosphodiesterase [Halomonas beimenensis]ATJ84656.1 diguanylate cyclase/phosphodiesterase (GGDEF & EAL domains) with PAS/PAC sensor(s) [Halomonas beimenensis]